jgi:hypothetical protein
MGSPSVSSFVSEAWSESMILILYCGLLKYGCSTPPLYVWLAVSGNFSVYMFSGVQLKYGRNLSVFGLSAPDIAFGALLLQCLQKLACN